MSKQQRWLQLFTAVVLVLTTFAVVPQAAQAQAFTTTFTVDRLTDEEISGNPALFCTASGNDCTLRQAMQLADNVAGTGKVLINFSPSLNATQNNILKIGVSNIIGPLPTLTRGNITVRGNTSFGIPLIAVVGTGGPTSATREYGIEIASNSNVIEGLMIYGFNNTGAIPFNGSGIYIDGNNNTVRGNFIGFDFRDLLTSAQQVAIGWTISLPNNNGVRVGGGTGNIVGGAVLNSGAANFISGNITNGVELVNVNSTFVQGNFIGVVRGSDLTSVDVKGNGAYGIQIASTGTFTSTNNIIGGEDPNAFNVVAGNGQAGIRLFGARTVSNIIQGNYIGTDNFGSATVGNPNDPNAVDFGNLADGIRIVGGANRNTIAGTIAAPMLISSNDGSGVVISGSGSSFNTISGVFIGTGLTGTEDDLGNNSDGVRFELGASNNTVTGSDDAPTYIVSNGGNGITIRGSTTISNSVANIRLGLVRNLNPLPGEVNGALQRGNAGHGILIDTANNSSISTNYISGNSGYGLRLLNAQSTTITGNFIGPALNRSETFSNTLGGILVESSAGTTRNTLIGGSDASPNMISGNGGPGITVAGMGTVSTTISANLIGILKQPTNAKLTAPGGNLSTGIRVNGGARETTISGNTLVDSRDELNVSGGGEAVVISGTGTNTTTVTLNRIGVVLDGITEIGISNRGGVLISGGPINTMVTSNTIKRNTGDAIQATDTSTTTISANSVALNGGSAIRLGGTAQRTTISRNTLDSNTGDGVSVEGAALRTDIISNTITRNVQTAVRVSGTAQRAKILDNLISRNIEGGILLTGTTIGGGGSASAPNHDIDPPILTAGSPLRLRINENGLLTGYVYTSTIKLEQSLAPPSACISCTIQLFGPDPELLAPDGQGFVKIADNVAVTDPTGRFATQILGFSQNRPRQVLLTATDGFGNTSQYAVFNVSAGLTLTPVNPVPAQQTAVPGQTVTYTHRLENTGSLDLTDIRLTSQSVNALNWTTAISPNTTASPLALPSGQNRLVTVTLTLPTGSAANVRAGLQDITKLIAASTQITQAQASTLMTTTVLAQGIIDITPKNQLGNGAPGSQVAYIHTITNSGNVTATVSLVAQTIDAAQGTLWSTTLSATTIEVPPGLTRDFTVRVTVPAGAQEKINGVPVRATTTITGTVAGFPNQTKVVSDVTGVTLVPRAIMLRDESTFGAAGQTVRIRHRVENISNGTATFKLRGNSSGGSTFKFISDTPGVTLTNDLFTLSNRSDPNTGETNVFNFIIEIKLNNRLLPGAVDVIDISLLESNGTVIGGANVQDRVTITAGQVQPRLWLPMIFNQQQPQ